MSASLEDSKFNMSGAGLLGLHAFVSASGTQNSGILMPLYVSVVRGHPGSESRDIFRWVVTVIEALWKPYIP